MAIELLDHIPGRATTAGRGRVPYAAKEIEEFLAAEDSQYAHVTIEGRAPKNMAQSFRLYLKKNPDISEKVAVHFIGGELYLERLK